MCLDRTSVRPSTRRRAANQAFNRTWNSAIQLPAVPSYINLFRLGGVWWRCSVPLKAISGRRLPAKPEFTVIESRCSGHVLFRLSTNLDTGSERLRARRCV